MSVQPTILIGYGDYGLELLRRLLVSASDRGVLLWSRDGQMAGTAGPRLRDLALFHCFPQTRQHGGSNPLEDDLYRQIRRLEDSDRMPAEIILAKDRLLAASRFATEGSAGSYALDVIVVAHPASAKDLSNLRDSMVRVMDELARDRNFVSPGAGSEVLNFIQILDFEKYWESTDFRERRFDDEVANYVGDWEQRHLRKRPSFSRIYFADSNPGGGYRSASQRIHEAVLFLELILFEDQRSHETLRHLVQQQSVASPIASTFGVRVIERQRGLMRRLASAYFSYFWLRYLAGSEAPRDRPTGVEIARILAPYHEGAVVSQGEIAELVEQCDRDLEATVPGFLRASLSAPRWEDGSGRDLLGQWLGDFERTARARIEEVRRGITKKASDLFDSRTRDRFSQIRSDTNKAVKSALQHSQYPSPVGSVVEELSRFAHSLDETGGPEPEGGVFPAFGAEHFEKLRRVYSDFLWFKNQQLNSEESTRRLWIWPFATAAFFTPMLVTAARELSVPGDDDSAFANALRNSLDVMKLPLSAWILILPVSFLLVFVAARRLRRRCDRGVKIYLHETQGLLRAAAAEMLQSNALRDYIRSRVRAVVVQRANRFKREVIREANFVNERLRLRQAEMIWLSGQMRQFCVRHGIDPDDPTAAYRPPAGDSSVYTYWIEQREDFRRMIEQNPTEPSKFQSLQGSAGQDENGLFAHWNERYCPAFLYPIQFIDWLSRQSAFKQQDVSAPNQGAERAQRTEEIIDSLSKIGLTPLGFVFSDGGQSPEPERFCLLPEEWRGQPDISAKIRSLGFGGEQMGALGRADRAYLLRYRHGVAASLLTGSAS